jgi:hypothetical protein
MFHFYVNTICIKIVLSADLCITMHNFELYVDILTLYYKYVCRLLMKFSSIYLSIYTTEVIQAVLAINLIYYRDILQGCAENGGRIVLQQKFAKRNQWVRSSVVRHMSKTVVLSIDK